MEEKAPIDELWRSYAQSKEPETKNLILSHYLPLVRSLVRRMMPQYMDFAETDELVNCGVLGLIDAVDKFDLSFGVKFETYAATRVRGEILDYLRKQDWASSSLRRKISRLEAAYEAAESRLCRPPDDEELAEAAEMSVPEVRELLYRSHMFNLVYFEDMLEGGALARLPLPGSEGPEARLEKKELLGILTELIEELPERERLVISLHYYEEMALKEIAKILKVSESRVSQIHSKVLLRLRGSIQKTIS